VKVSAQTTDPLAPPAAWTWPLPDGPECARHARAVLDEALTALGVPAEARADARLMVSELATNAHQHASGRRPHELWLSRDAASGTVYCTVFDRDASTRLPGYSWTSGDCGRGLAIVRELSGGRWGTRADVARLGEPEPGKAVWFAIT
jgi:hypothetical protein